MKWLLKCSKDAIDIDFETIIESDSEPDFWTCYDLAAEHDCEWWSLDTL